MTAEDVLGRAEALIRGLDELQPEEWGRIALVFESDPCPLSPVVTTDQQASALAASIWGLHRVDPTAQETSTRVLLQAVGEFIAAPLGSPDLRALLVLSVLTRSRWRGQGAVRDPRSMAAVLALPLR